MASVACGFVSWYEVFVSSDRGRREVHYYLKRGDGGSDLAVVGKEKSLRHMTYHYALRDRFLSSSLTKLKSRREVVEWLSSVVSDSQRKTSQPSDRIMDIEGEDACPSTVVSQKDVQQIKLGQYTRDFSWLGSPWTCKRKRWHYPSFSRNGFKISVHDFVYVLAEEGKRLVAYLEDMYEDSRSNRMVVVRWFHKIDEVDIVLPHNFSDREIYFSLCLQDLSVECIDGAATVLSPQHFEKFQNEAKHTLLEPYVCEKQFDNDDIKPFDITQVKGYWKQEILRYMYALSSSKAHTHSQQSEDDTSAEMRPRKRYRRLRKDDVQNTEKRKPGNISSSPDVCRNSGVVFSPKWGCASKTFIGKELNNASSGQLSVGSEIEVLSHDSGIRGCWFRASIVKKRREKVKVQYHNLQDADDESNKLMEWLSASRVAAADQLGLRINGRLVIRPQPSKDSKAASVYNVGTIVDVWWHDGWWEGIIIQKESEDKFRVYLPGEKQELVLGRDDLRHSREWIGNRWMHMQERPDIATSILSRPANDGFRNKTLTLLSQDAVCDSKQPGEDRSQSSDRVKTKELSTVPDLSKDGLLAKLRWTGSRKRSQPSGSGSLASRSVSSPSTSSSPCERGATPNSMKVDHENCKYLGDSLFTSSVVPSLSSLQFCMVMKINVDCNACCRKLRRIILKMKAIEKHLIEKESHRLIVFGRFRPSDIAIKIRRKMNRRVEILDVEEMEEPEPVADQNPPPEQAQVVPGTIDDHNPNPMFPSLEHDDWRPPVFPSLAAHQYRSFSSSRPDFAVACLPEPDMEERFWHYGHDYEVVGDRDHTFSCHDYYHY